MLGVRPFSFLGGKRQQQQQQKQEQQPGVDFGRDMVIMDSSSHGEFVLSIDQGTSSSRCMVFDREGRVRAEYQLEHEQFYPQPGYVEHDAEEIWVRNECVG